MAGFRSLSLDNCLPLLEILDLSYGHSFSEFSFLNPVFEKATKLKKLFLSYSSIVDSKFKDVKMETLPVSLEEFNFSGNVSYTNFGDLLNSLFARCTNLKVFKIEDCSLNDSKLERVDFSKISVNLEEISFASNPEIKKFNFLNSIFRRATNIKKINLKKAKIEKNNEIMFDLLSKTLEVFDAEEDGFFDDEFSDWLVSKLERCMNLDHF